MCICCDVDGKKDYYDSIHKIMKDEKFVKQLNNGEFWCILKFRPQILLQKKKENTSINSILIVNVNFFFLDQILIWLFFFFVETVIWLDFQKQDSFIWSYLWFGMCPLCGWLQVIPLGQKEKNIYMGFFDG